jgi:ATP-dependent Clp protease adaptor protein ClpS
MSTKHHTDTESNVSEQHKTVHAPRYRVIMHNDDYTTMEFVVEILQSIFHQNPTDATHTMLTIHTDGQAVCGCYGYEIAETKIAQAHQCATTAGYPLRCSMEKA